MLGGQDPLLIFQFSFLNPGVSAETIAKIPVISSIPNLIEQPPIPVYLTAALGVLVDTEEKETDIETQTETLTNGHPPDVNQKGISNVVYLTFEAKKDNVGLALLSALIDLCFTKATSKEYAISYFNGTINIFRGHLTTFNTSQTANTDKVMIRIGLTAGVKNPNPISPVPSVGALQGSTPLDENAFNPFPGIPHAI